MTRAARGAHRPLRGGWRTWLAAGAALLCGCGAGGGGEEHSMAGGAQSPTDAWADARARMVREQIEARGVRDPRVLEALRAVPRHAFVPEHLADAAYADEPLPIGRGQTISQPYIVARMTELARIGPGARVLEVGTGSGYQAAVLGELAAEVYSIEIVAPLGERARETLEALGYANVHVRIGDGWAGWPEHAPFDAILVTAAPERVPPALLEQLAVGGRLVIPVGDWDQMLEVHTRTPDGFRVEEVIPVRFVPMTGGESSGGPAR